jgi:CDP-paratose 2-epimerase
MRVAVTGSEGFIGRHLVRALTERGHFVSGFDKVSKRYLDDVAWAGAMEGSDFIVHLAASVSTLGSIRRPYDTFRDTVMTTATVCEAASRGQIPLLLTSSVKARDGKTPYGAAKRMSEIWAGELSRTHGFPLITNRPGTIYGPGQEGSEESGWVAWFLEARRDLLPVTINGDGNQIRDLLYVSDYVELMVKQIEEPASYYSIMWDVGGGEENVVSVRMMADYLGLRYEYGPPRYGDCEKYVGVNDVPGWAPTTRWQESGMFR